MDVETFKALLGAGGLTILTGIGTYTWRLLSRMLDDRKAERAAELAFRQSEALAAREERKAIRTERRLALEAKRRDIAEARKIRAEEAREEREERRQFIVAALTMRDGLAAQTKVLDTLSHELRSEAIRTGDLPLVIVPGDRSSTRPPAERRPR